MRCASEVLGIRSEYAWIANAYPESTVLDQALVVSEDRKRRFDLLTVRTKDDRRVQIWFDITAMF
jgi:hypothetical protein